MQRFYTFLHPLCILVIILDGRCREENRPQAQPVHNACESALHACAPFDVYSRELGTKGILGS